ncbi:N-6 DNA methylase [Akkermansiaceae bacterium]|nr:N-6 DNA methylase [Akkermansiaceae bacterium]
MSDLEAIWKFFDGFLRIRNAWAHNVVADANDQNSIPDSSCEKVQRLNKLLKGGDRREMNHWARNFEESLSPRLLYEFTARIANHLKPSSIFDPVCGYGMLLACSAEAAKAKVVHGVDINSKAVKVASIVLGDPKNVMHGDACFVGEGLLEGYDLIVADPPMGARLSEDQAQRLGVKISCPLADALLIAAVARLNEGGKALFVVPPSFFFTKTSGDTVKVLNEAGYRISAAIQVPWGTRNNTNIGGYLLVVESGKQEEIFVGQLPSDPAGQKHLHVNLISRKQKGGPELGRMISLSDFKGFDSVVAKEQLSRVARDGGFQCYESEEVFLLWERVSKSGVKTNELKAEVDSLFLSLRGRGKERASTRFDSLTKGRSDNIYHLKVNLDIADPSFLAHWFNDSRVGQLFLSSMQRGTASPVFSINDLRRAVIPLPSLADQKLLIEGMAYLGKIRADVEEFESIICSGTEPPASLLDDIQAINQEDRYEDWLDSLPFPLASILWRHYASQDSYRQRYETLLHFFEATAAFLATIHLSAIMKDKKLWDEYGPKLIQNLGKFNLSMERATFGSWKLVVELIGSAVRKEATKEENEGSNLWNRLYGLSDSRNVNMLTSPELNNVLQQANKIRNNWQGHTGAISEDSAKSIHDQLIGLVNNLRGLFGRRWKSYELIQPDLARYKDGVYYISCRRITGTRSNPFEEREYQSIEPLESGSLYLFDSLTQRGLKLRPFIQVIPSPQKQATACFIFNRVERESMRWVSYHFDQESEISQVSQGLSDTLAMFEDGEKLD